MKSVKPTAITEWFRKSEIPVPGHFNQSQIFRCAKRLNPYTLKATMRMLCGYHENLRAVWDGNQLVVRDMNCLNLVLVEQHLQIHCGNQVVSAEINFNGAFFNVNWDGQVHSIARRKFKFLHSFFTIYADAEALCAALQIAASNGQHIEAWLQFAEFESCAPIASQMAVICSFWRFRDRLGPAACPAVSRIVRIGCLIAGLVHFSVSWGTKGQAMFGFHGVQVGPG